eukprot:scaffold151318_cov40-Prasinocladus_malaysianus.AAC.1
MVYLDGARLAVGHLCLDVCHLIWVGHPDKSFPVRAFAGRASGKIRAGADENLLNQGLQALRSCQPRAEAIPTNRPVAHDTSNFHD